MNNQTSITSTLVAETKTPVSVKVLTVLGMMTLMGGTITGVMTYINLGYSSSFFNQWLSAFLLATVTVMPAGFILMTALTKFAEKFLPKLDKKFQNILIGIAMALIMESGLALSTTINNIGMTDLNQLFSTWFNTVTAALPFAVAMMLLVSLTIKPKVEALLKS
ncbi:hypothetical protein BCU84_07600 [Shewanella sp. 10N.286.51.B7]|uniref:DUF2798 domain-containing protein n=1 Tax=Shewanella sp. 10N.286.51.B7 TaxID=1880836 RepID=UPI000C8350BC|nr:DUF2798 domain-containing protein [Shewanella sp. 10N.286.51.B7]PMG78462.1 hypothetical protein BCU84_07600 [Shewanella sp. 10N.286.51.B7]